MNRLNHTIAKGYRKATRAERRRLYYELVERKLQVEVLDWGGGNQTYIVYRTPLPRGRPPSRVIRRKA